MAKEQVRRRMSLLRHKRLRNRLSGTEECPRLAVFRSTQHIYAQLIDDTAGRTLVAADTLQSEIAKEVAGKKPTEAAQVVGKAVAEKAKEAGIKKVVFDRGGFKYHGRVKALADGAREAGLEF
jgi:large subunit ribosomal protein L18